jgi:hypothetical protein
MFILDIEICNPELLPHYKSQIMTLERTYNYMSSDSGFDLYLPKDIVVKPKESLKIDLKIQCEPRFPGGYYLYPRSSMAKTPLRLKNSVGIVDSMFRGNLIAYIENMSDTETFEGYANGGWGSIAGSGGGSAGGYYKGNLGAVGNTDNKGNLFRINSNTQSNNITISSGENALTVGPLVISSGFTLTIEEGGRAVII